MKIEYTEDNAAFSGGTAPAENARILRKIADQVEEGRTDGVIMDVNGNRVGTWSTDDNA